MKHYCDEDVKVLCFNKLFWIILRFHFHAEGVLLIFQRARDPVNYVKLMERGYSPSNHYIATELYFLAQKTVISYLFSLRLRKSIEKTKTIILVSYFFIKRVSL